MRRAQGGDQATQSASTQTIGLHTKLSFRTSFGFPLQHSQAIREVLIGAFLLVALPGVGWILNMGHRIQMVHRMQHGLPAWPAWTDPKSLFRHGCVTLLGMIYWHAPGVAVISVGRFVHATPLVIAGIVLFSCGTFAVPGYMTHYCREFSVAEVFSPLLAIRRIRAVLPEYLFAWSIAGSALLLSLLGLAFFGVAFFVTSVWFWQVAGFSFATVFTRAYGLRDAREASANREVGTEGENH